MSAFRGEGTLLDAGPTPRSTHHKIEADFQVGQIRAPSPPHGRSSQQAFALARCDRTKRTVDRASRFDFHKSQYPAPLCYNINLTGPGSRASIKD